jgi:hypothetical protein
VKIFLEDFEKKFLLLQNAFIQTFARVYADRSAANHRRWHAVVDAYSTQSSTETGGGDAYSASTNTKQPALDTTTQPTQSTQSSIETGGRDAYSAQSSTETSRGDVYSEQSSTETGGGDGYSAMTVMIYCNKSAGESAQHMLPLQICYFITIEKEAD